MKPLALAILLALGSTLAAAADAPPPSMDCGPTPEYPGRLGSYSQKASFDKALKAYEKCIKGYVVQREAASKAHLDAAQKAIDDYNALVLKMRADSGEDVSKKADAPAGNTATPSSGSAPTKSGY